MTTIFYDSYSLNSDGVYTTDTDVDSAPPIDVQAERLAEADGAVIVKRSLDPKVFRCEGFITADAVEELRAVLDTFKGALNKQNQNFDIDDGSGIRRYIATPRNMIISRPKGLNTATWSVEFFCANPVGLDTDESTLLAATAITGAQASTAITIAGSYKAEPLITVTVTAVTGGTTKTITINNDSTLRGLTVTRTWTNGDVLEVDCLNKTVYVNNTVVEFGGQFPAWDPGSSAIGYLDDFTTRTVSLTATYFVRYL